MSENTETTQEDPRDAEIARLRAIGDRFAPLAGIADALERDPSKYFAVKAAMEGQAPQQTQQTQQAPAPLSAADLEDLKSKFFADPVRMTAEIANAARQNAMADFARAAQPFAETTSDLFIETFKSRKAGEDEMYKQILPFFERELGDVNRQNLIALPAGDRQRILELRWQAAAAAAFRKAAASKPTDQARNLGGGGSGPAPDPKKSASRFEQNTDLNRLSQILASQGLIDASDLEAIETEIEQENT